MAAPLIATGRKCTDFIHKSTDFIAFCHIHHRNFAASSIFKSEWKKDSQVFQDSSKDFRTFEIIKKPKRQFTKKMIDYSMPSPRYTRMRTDQDWTAVWPTAKTFNWSVVPLPVRQGAAEFSEGVQCLEEYGIPPGKYANTELIKIPNFLHLTPKHIKQQCAAIKKYCTRWPAGLENKQKMEKHFPVEVITSDYCFSSPSVRDPRARVVTVKLKLSSLELDYHAKDKIIRLLGDKYNSQTDVVTIVSDRCPLKQQNYDYLQYVLTALFFESWKVEPWESDKTEADMEKYLWDMSTSKKKLVNLLNMYKDRVKDLDETEGRQFTHIQTEITEDSVSSLEEVKSYQAAIEELHNTGENIQTLNTYKQSVLDMLKINNNSSDSQKATS